MLAGYRELASQGARALCFKGARLDSQLIQPVIVALHSQPATSLINTSNITFESKKM